MPDQLQVGGTEILGESMQCGHENKIGVGVYPSYTATSGPTWPTAYAPTSTPSVTAKGPAFVQVAIAWNGKFDCTGTAPAPTASGTSTFTLFPDGRLVRHDTLATGALLPANTSCGCLPPTSDYFATSFLAVQGAPFTTLLYSAGTATSPLTLPASDTWIDDPNPRWACLATPNARRLAVAWPGTVTSVLGASNDGGTRVALDGAGTLITFLFDWIYDHTTVPDMQLETYSAWFFAADVRAHCDATAMATLFSDYTDPRRLSIAADGRNAFADLDPTTGLYRIVPAEPATAATYTVIVESGNAGVSGGFALSLPFATGATPVVQLDSMTLVENRDFLVQHDAGTPIVHTLWFKDPLPQGHVLTLHQP